MEYEYGSAHDRAACQRMICPGGQPHGEHRSTTDVVFDCHASSTNS
jgi:hypothetical protein